MKERPILFSTPMVEAILEGSKTMTRRVVKFPAEDGEYGWHPVPEGFEYLKGGSLKPVCPYGKIGDVLWVRETWQETTFLHTSDENYGYIYKASENGLEWAKTEEWKWKPSIFMPRAACRIKLEITNIRIERLQEISSDDAAKEGIEFDVWDQALVARKYDEKDAFFQVWSEHLPHYSHYDTINQDSFKSLWNSINGEESWNKNPQVWVIEFKQITQP